MTCCIKFNFAILYFLFPQRWLFLFPFRNLWNSWLHFKYGCLSNRNTSSYITGIAWRYMLVSIPFVCYLIYFLFRIDSVIWQLSTSFPVGRASPQRLHLLCSTSVRPMRLSQYLGETNIKAVIHLHATYSDSLGVADRTNHVSEKGWSRLVPLKCRLFILTGPVNALTAVLIFFWHIRLHCLTYNVF